MSRILSIACLTFRTAVRSRVLMVTATAIIISILWLPSVMKGDGTPAGTVKLYLHYALGWTVILVSMTALWNGAGAFAQEVENRQIQLLVTKPVRTFHLWTGKWLGLMFTNAVLLGLAGTLTYGVLLWNTRPAVLSEAERLALREEIFTARKTVTLEPDPSFLPDPSEYMPPHRKRVGMKTGDEIFWFHEATEHIDSGDALTVQYRFAGSRALDKAPLKMFWMVGPENEPDRFTLSTASAPNVSHTFQVPPGVLDPNAGIRITCRNMEHEQPAYMLFAVDDGLQLLVRKGGFEMNYARALIVFLARLSFFSALGLAAGALFSFPVAAFVSFAALLLTAFTRFIAAAAATGLGAMPEIAATGALLSWDPLIRCVFAAVNRLIPPLWRYDPCDSLIQGGLISWRFAASSILVLTGVYSGALALLSGWLFSRRELGRPS